MILFTQWYELSKEETKQERFRPNSHAFRQAVAVGLL